MSVQALVRIWLAAKSVLHSRAFVCKHETMYTVAHARVVFYSDRSMYTMFRLLKSILGLVNKQMVFRKHPKQNVFCTYAR